MPARSVLMLGTSHSLQMASQELTSFLEKICACFAVRAIAEEMSDDAIQEYDGAMSRPMQVAHSLGLAHRHCDPGKAERAELGILQENDIRSQINLPEKDIDAQLNESWGIREAFWLEKILDLDLWPVLFVCGADHVESFCDLLKCEGITVHIVAADWEA